MEREPLVAIWQARSLRLPHGDRRPTPYSPLAARIRSAVGLATDVDGLRLLLASILGERYRVGVAEDGLTVGFWRR